MNQLEGKYLKLHKIEDLKFGGNHPNNINVGYILRGWCIDEPRVGGALYLYISKSIQMAPNCWTSIVTNIDYENMKLQTKNSVYSIEIDDEAEDITMEDLQAGFQGIKEYKLKE